MKKYIADGMKKYIDDSMKKCKKEKVNTNRTYLFKQLILICLLAVFLSSLAFAYTVGDCGYFGTYVYNGICVPDLLVNLSTILMLIGLLIGAIFYVLGIALEHTRIKEWSKDFLFQILGSAVILLIYLGIVASLNYFAPAIYNSNLAFPLNSSVRSAQSADWTTVQDHAKTYVNCLIRYTKEATMNIIGISSALSVIASTSLTITAASYNGFFPVFPTGGGLTSIMAVALGALATTLVQLKIQLEILYLYSALFSIILPIGLIFRSFPYTRGAGAAMIAIVFGFTIFLPIFYFIIEDVGYKFYPHDVCAEKPPEISFTQLVGISIKASQEGALSALQDYFKPGGEFEGLIKILAIQATILPFVVYLVVLNITKRLAELLGGEIDFSTLVRLI